eukprot:COSAG04_NODE_853_length_9864_cov_7.564260_7_plen_555_part_00
MAARRIGALARHIGSGDAAAAVETEVKRTVGPEEQALLAAAEELFPGGTPNGNSTAKGFLFAEGQGAYVFDKTGTKYLDLAMGSGPMFIGHAHPHVVEAIQSRAAKGVTFFGINEEAIRLAEMVTDAVECAEKIRFANNGTEAAMFATRALRTYRRRDKILKFECSFHGNADFAAHNLTTLAPYPQAVPDSAGVPRAATEDMIIAPFNDLETTAAIIAEHADELAGVICEPFQRVVPPDVEFLRGVRDLTKKHGIPLLFDEIVTGFRFAYGGAQEAYGVIPDMCLLSKVPTGGLPLGIIAGSAELMGVFDSANFGTDYGDPGPNGRDNWTLPMVSTYMGNPLGCAAGIATLEVLQEMGKEGYAATHARGERLKQGLQAALDEGETRPLARLFSLGCCVAHTDGWAVCSGLGRLGHRPPDLLRRPVWSATKAGGGAARACGDHRDRQAHHAEVQRVAARARGVQGGHEVLHQHGPHGRGHRHGDCSVQGGGGSAGQRAIAMADARGGCLPSPNKRVCDSISVIQRLICSPGTAAETQVAASSSSPEAGLLPGSAA